MAPLPRGTPVTINGLGSPALNGATGIIYEPAADDASDSRLVVRVSFPGGERKVGVKQARLRAVTRAPEFSPVPMMPVGLDTLLPVVQELAGPRAVCQSTQTLCFAPPAAQAQLTFVSPPCSQALHPALPVLQKWITVMKQHQINFSTAAPWTIPRSCQEAVSIRLLSAEGEVQRQMVLHSQIPTRVGICASVTTRTCRLADTRVGVLQACRQATTQLDSARSLSSFLCRWPSSSTTTPRM